MEEDIVIILKCLFIVWSFIGISVINQSWRDFNKKE